MLGCTPLPQPHRDMELDYRSIHPIGLPITATVKLKPFNRIISNGFYTLTILTGQPDYSIEITGDKQIVEQVVAKVCRNTLQIHMQDRNYICPGKLEIVVRMRCLNYLKKCGCGSVHAPNLQSRGLVVDDNGSGALHLGGHYDIREINFRGNSKFKSYWIDSDKLKITAEGNSVIFLAGRVKRLDVVAYDYSYLDLKYLRAETAYIDTLDYSRADVAVSGTANFLASGHSYIYYFIHPCFLGAYMRESGSIAGRVYSDRFCSDKSPFCHYCNSWCGN